MFELRVLGIPTLSAEDTVRLPQNHQLLLIFLAGNGVPVSRAAVADLIWPSKSSSSSRHSLSQAIYLLRKLGPEVIACEGLDLSLGSNVVVDLDQFRSSIVKRDFRAAAALYRGPFAAGVIASQDSYNEWIEGARWGLHRQARDICLNLKEAADFEPALALSEKLLTADPFDEDVWQIRLEILSLLGRSNEVSAQYARLQKAWPEEIGRPWPHPQPPLREVPSGTSLSAQPKGLGGIFVGRRPELDDLVSLWRSQPSGFEHVVISGEAGIGKTALADRFRRLLVLRGASTVWASAHPLESSLPFGIAAQWLEASSPAQAELLEKLNIGVPRSSSTPVPGPFDSAVLGRELLYSALSRELTRSARPLCIFLDDLQWADDASLGLVGYLRRYSSTQRIMVVMTRRSDLGREVGGLLANAKTLELSPLGVPEITELCRSRSDFEQEEALAAAVDALYERTGGNPLLLTALLSEQHIGDLDEHRIPTTAVAFLKERLERLSNPSRIVLAALGILRTGSVETLEAVTQLRSGLDESLAELHAASFVVSEAGQVRPRHGMMADVALGVIGPVLERQMRGRAAKLLQPGSAPLAAVQYDLAGHRERAHEASLQAATASVELFAFEEALYFFGIALANAPSDEAKASICCRISDVHLSRRNYSAATAALNQAQALRVSRDLQLKIEAHSAIVRLHGVQDPTALDDAKAVLGQEALRPSTELSARLAMAACFAAHAEGRPSEVREWADFISRVAGELPSGKLRIRVLLTVGVMKALYRSAAESAGEIQVLLNEAGRWPDLLATAFATLGSARVAAGQSSEAEAAFLAALEIVETTGSQEPLFMISNNLGALYQEEGRFDEAAAMYDRALDTQPEDAVPAWAQLTLDNLSTLAYERGAWEEAVSRAEDLIGRFEKSHLSTRTWFSQHSIRGLSCLALGRRAAAQKSRAAIEKPYITGAYSSNDISYVEIFLARIAEIEGRSTEAVARLTARASEYLDRDFFCAARMEVEKLRLLLPHSPSAVWEAGVALRQTLVVARARPLVDRLDGILTRASTAST